MSPLWALIWVWVPVEATRTSPLKVVTFVLPVGRQMVMLPLWLWQVTSWAESMFRSALRPLR